jgi:heme A synthase
MNRPVPRWLHVWAILTATLAGGLLLLLGGLVTTLRAGMADPIWPTEPWYLFFIDWREPDRGYLVEHTHRLAGFAVGACASVLAIGVWACNPRSGSRWLGLLGIIGLLATYGQFHRQMMAQINAAVVTVPLSTVGGIAASLIVCVVVALADLSRCVRGAGLRLFALVALVGVMIQGLLGGFRVKLHALVGLDLAIIHGIFGQVVFGLLVSLAVLTAKRSPWPELAGPERSRVARLAWIFVGVVFLQLVWGALIRHNPTPISQRLHLMTAFLVLGVGVWLVRAVHESTSAWRQFRAASVVVLVLFFLQITLGVEAWLGKFGTGVLPELQKPTAGMAVARTGHMLVGSGILATAISFVLLARRPLEHSGAEARAEAAPVPVLVGSPRLGDAS